MSPLSSGVKTGASMRYMSWFLCMVYACTIYAQDSWALHLNCTAELIKIAKKHGFRYLERDPLASYDMKDNVPNTDTKYSLIRTKRRGTRCASVVVANNGLCAAGLQMYDWRINGVGRPACYGNRSWIRSLEHIQADLTLTCSGRDLSITLVSPKTISSLLRKRPYDETSAGLSDWAFMSTHCWGEGPSGFWVIQMENNGDSTDRGTLFKLKLELRGTDERMSRRRMQRSAAQQCAVRMSDGSCECCVHPLYVFGSICLTSCPPRYYESDGDGTRFHRRCLPCHRSCHTCSGKQETDCLDCPPYSTLDSSLSTCSPLVHPWDHRVTVGMDRTAVVLCVLVGGPLVVLFAFWAMVWMVSMVLSLCVSARNHTAGSPGRGNDQEAGDVEMFVFDVTERPAENAVITSASTDIPNT
ncbi:proprotein convertase subtilisin/kexin type 4 isoform X2 [Esox lucius]|uniref:proprotein convertase subtilisin/kexin type 4 isoform X2 n=1 Tax=Esox lucius TaxID=8010 RepID=UPI001476FADD|nr:proprotein convertase subtilisin/kexin type 4 isoform X2 [Esox lucius]